MNKVLKINEQERIKASLVGALKSTFRLCLQSLSAFSPRHARYPPRPTRPACFSQPNITDYDPHYGNLSVTLLLRPCLVPALPSAL